VNKKTIEQAEKLIKEAERLGLFRRLWQAIRKALVRR